jgi:hypothetical protein
MHYPTRIVLVSVAFALAIPALAQDRLKELDTGSSTREQVLTERLAIGSEVREARINVATFEPKTTGAWHVHPAPVYVYVLQGTLTFESEGKKPRVVKACAAVRGTESLTQSREVRRETSGPSDSPEGES